MKFQKKRLTLLMPVYNGEKYLREAIDSILNQTYPDFEFLIIDDGSTDRSYEIISSYQDSRIKLLKNSKNLGLIQTLNIGLENSDTEYIARMDCDDISLPQRLEKQIVFMDKNPSVGISGTWVKPFGGKSGKVWKYETDPEKIKAQLFFDSCLAHPSIIIRESMLAKNKLSYDCRHLHAEDWGLWQKASFCFDLGNLPQLLLLYRISDSSVRMKNNEIYEQTLFELDKTNLESLGIEIKQQDIILHRKIASWSFEKSKEFVKDSEEWLLKLLKANNATNIYPVQPFAEVISQRFYSICSNADCLGMFSYKTYFGSSLSQARKNIFLSKTNFLRRCLFKS